MSTENLGQNQQFDTLLAKAKRNAKIEIINSRAKARADIRASQQRVIQERATARIAKIADRTKAKIEAMDRGETESGSGIGIWTIFFIFLLFLALIMTIVILTGATDQKKKRKEKFQNLKDTLRQKKQSFVKQFKLLI